MSSDTEKNLEKARLLIEAGKSEEARFCLLELLKDNPNNQAALLILGGSYFTDGMYSEAEMVFERLVLMAPGEGKFSIALFNTLWKSGRSEEALEEIRRFMSIADSINERETLDQYMKITNSIADGFAQDGSNQSD